MFCSSAWVSLTLFAAELAKGLLLKSLLHHTADTQSWRAKIATGNICRSPSAEAVFKDKVAKAGLTDSFFIDSCGLGGGNESW